MPVTGAIVAVRYGHGVDMYNMLIINSSLLAPFDGRFRDQADGLATHLQSGEFRTLSTLSSPLPWDNCAAVLIC